jgi:hypothetical protein
VAALPHAQVVQDLTYASSRVGCDEVQAPESDLIAWLHLISVVIDPKDETHLKHDESARKRSLPGTPTIGSIYSSYMD